MNAGKRQLLAGDAAAASRSFEDATAAFVRAADGAESPWMRVVGWLPLVGRTPDTITSIAYAGEETAGAGRTLADAVADLPGGLGSLAPSGGRFPIERIASLAGAVDRAAALVSRAHARVAASPGETLGTYAGRRCDGARRWQVNAFTAPRGSSRSRSSPRWRNPRSAL